MPIIKISFYLCFTSTTYRGEELLGVETINIFCSRQPWEMRYSKQTRKRATRESGAVSLSSDLFPIKICTSDSAPKSVLAEK